MGTNYIRVCSTGKLIVPLSTGITTANVHDGNMYCTLVEPLAGLVENVLCDPAYDNSKLYQFSNKKNLRLITPIKQYPHTPPERIKLAEFYNSQEGQELYRNRRVSIEPLFEIFKDTFNIRTVPVKELNNVKSSVYQLAVYYNCIIGVKNPRRIKRMLCC